MSHSKKGERWSHSHVLLGKRLSAIFGTGDDSERTRIVMLGLVFERKFDGAARIGTGVDRVDTLLPTVHFVAMKLVVLVILPNQRTSNQISFRICEDSMA